MRRRGICQRGAVRPGRAPAAARARGWLGAHAEWAGKLPSSGAPLDLRVVARLEMLLLTI